MKLTIFENSLHILPILKLTPLIGLEAVHSKVLNHGSGFLQL
jgi:hypothetical protein